VLQKRHTCGRQYAIGVPRHACTIFADGHCTRCLRGRRDGRISICMPRAGIADAEVGATFWLVNSKSAARCNRRVGATTTSLPGVLSNIDRHAFPRVVGKAR
jgi:hypothetical protein